jgi:hypothetical protein
LKNPLYAASAAVLVVGLGAAALLYLFADDEGESAALYEMQISKRYVRQLQQFGGRASVLFDELNRWFSGLWHGTSLAVTVAWLSVLAAAALFLVAHLFEKRG